MLEDPPGFIAHEVAVEPVPMGRADDKQGSIVPYGDVMQATLRGACLHDGDGDGDGDGRRSRDFFAQRGELLRCPALPCRTSDGI